MDFEEGEVDDISDSESDVVSPASEKHVSEGHFGHNPVCRKTMKDKFKRKHSRGRADEVNMRSPYNMSLNDGGPADNRTNCYLDEEDFQVSSRERDRNIIDSRRRKKRRKEKFVRPVHSTKCRFYMDGRCQKGDNCPYEHNFQPPKRQELCKFYAVGVCSKGKSCLFLHSEFPCKFFHLHGKCNQGADCKFYHGELDKNSQLLLDRIAAPKDGVDSFVERDRDTGRSLLGPGSYSGLNEHGDIDYRCGHTENRNNMAYGRQSPPSLLFTPVFNQRPYAPEPCQRLSDTADQPVFRSPHNPRLRSQFLPDMRFAMGSSSQFLGQPFIPTRLESPAFRHMSTGQRLRADMQLNPRPLQPGMPSAQSSVFGEFSNPSGVPSFRPPHYRPPIRNLPPNHCNGFDTGYPTDEELVRSELDKMAALLASSKPPCSSSNTLIDPRNKSPEQKSNQAYIATPTEDTPTIPSTPKAAQDQSVSLSSPEGGSSDSQPQQPLNKSSAVTWRLIQLDMNVKIPYPLMQLNVEDLPHRHDDPRLRGHLTAFRMQSNQANSITSLPEATQERAIVMDTRANSADITKLSNDASEGFQTIPPPSSAVQRRPVKLQLNELANTFLVAQQPMRLQSRHGDRSYLDDPRFRRRRIISNVLGLPVVTEDDNHQHSNAPTSHSELRASVVEIKGEMQPTSTD